MCNTGSAGSGYTCSFCGMFVPDGTYHNCRFFSWSYWPLYSYNICSYCPLMARCKNAAIPTCFQEKSQEVQDAENLDR